MLRFLLTRICSRKAVTVVIFFSIGAFLFYNSNLEFALNGRGCLTPRSNPHGIKAPYAQDGKFLSDMWTSLHKLFDEHMPSPAHIDTPKHKGFPHQDNLDGYFNLTDEEALHTRQTHEKLLKKLPEYPRGQFKGKGVVVLGGGRYTEFAATGVGMLREVGSLLPVEVWSKDHSEESDEWCADIRKEGMVCRRLADYMDMGALKHPYQWKVFTLLYSSFEEILFLDADSIPVKNPDYVFESRIYKENGAVLWPDYWKHTGSPWAPYLTGLTEDKKSDMLIKEMSVESGQIYWNKASHWKTLILATYYNYFGADFFYTVFNNGMSGWGDKDTFPMACKATKNTYYMIPHNLDTIFISGTLTGVGMAQADPLNETAHEPLFMHCNILKWSMREFLCEGDCKAIKGQGANPFHWMHDRSPIIHHLRQNKRVYEPDQLLPKGIDPEPLIWKSIEHTACRGAWQNEQMCKNARNYMEATFGFKFTKHGFETKEGLDHSVCIQGPWAKDPKPGQSAPKARS